MKFFSTYPFKTGVINIAGLILLISFLFNCVYLLPSLAFTVDFSDRTLQFTLRYGSKPEYKGIVIAAPHEGYDINTVPIARLAASDSGVSLVEAYFFRDIRAGRFINVNRPTGILPEEFPNRTADNSISKESWFPQADGVFKTYSHLLQFAGQKLPLRLLIEIHGHSRKDHENKSMQVIEIASINISPLWLNLLRSHYILLCSKAKISDPFPMYFENLDSQYIYKGRKYNFRYTALKTKELGSLNKNICTSGLHIELPSNMRFNKDLMLQYSPVISGLLKWYISAIYKINK
jgi:hypothetical protein